MNSHALFEDRTDAGRRLAARLAGRGIDDPVVLALPRGGVPVAVEIAQRLRAPLDLLLVRKIGHPWQPELAVAAVAEDEEGGVVSLALREGAGTPPEADVEAGRREIARRRRAYLGDRDRVPVHGRTAIVVDDGVATGTSLRAALQAVRARGPARLVVAVPVAPPDEAERLAREVDEFLVLETPASFHAVGAFYRRFEQLDDDEVVRLLAAHHAA